MTRIDLDAMDARYSDERDLMRRPCSGDVLELTAELREARAEVAALKQQVERLAFERDTLKDAYSDRVREHVEARDAGILLYAQNSVLRAACEAVVKAHDAEMFDATFHGDRAEVESLLDALKSALAADGERGG